MRPVFNEKFETQHSFKKSEKECFGHIPMYMGKKYIMDKKIAIIK